MRMRLTLLPLLLMPIAAVGCSDGGTGGEGTLVLAPAPTSTPTPPSTPSPTSTPAPTSTPTPDPTTPPTPAPSPTPTGYLTFSEIYIYRFGSSGITLPGGCSSLALQDQPPELIGTTAFGQGLSFRFVVTPQVWAIGGDVGIGFDGRDADATATGTEVAFAKMIGPDTARFSITRPAVGPFGFDYSRLATVSATVAGTRRLYQCLLGIPTLLADLTAAPLGTFGRTAMLGSAFVRDGGTTVSYSLAQSTVSISADLQARTVALSIRLVGTPSATQGPDVDLGTIAATAPIDPATGNFSANLALPGRTIRGTASGRLMGPEAIEVGVTVGASVAATANAPAMSFAGVAFGRR
jgi:hypothetical protein